MCVLCGYVRVCFCPLLCVMELCGKKIVCVVMCICVFVFCCVWWGCVIYFNLCVRLCVSVYLSFAGCGGVV